MKKQSPYVYLFTMGHFSVDWAQGAIPALLPYFITTCNLSYQDGATLILPTCSYPRCRSRSSDITPIRFQNPGSFP